MANIRSFPNNKDEYIGAEAVMRWHHGRSSGVFGENGGATVSPILDTMKVRVSDGTGWLTDANGNGIVWWIDNEEQTGHELELSVDMADAVLNRIDRVVVSWDTTNYVAVPEVIILKGTPASAPSAPALTNDTLVRQISLAKIYVLAGASSLKYADVADERLDPTVCGIVTEKVSVDTNAMHAQVSSFIGRAEEEIDDFVSATTQEADAFQKEQTQKWDAFFAHAQEDIIVPVPGASDTGKAVIVSDDGDGYTLANIQTEIPITSDVPADADMWIDPSEPSGSVELGFDSGELPEGTLRYTSPNATAKFATVTIANGHGNMHSVIVDCSIVHNSEEYDLPAVLGGTLFVITNKDGTITFNIEAVDTAAYIASVCGYGYVGGSATANDAEFFEVTMDGVLSLKPEYGVSDNGVAGSKNAELPKNLVIPYSVGGVEVKGIADSAFAGNLMVESISIPDTVEAIPDNCFSQCSNLKLVSADSVKSIGKKAFESTGIEAADFPNVTSIGSAAFLKSKTKEANFPSLASEGMGSNAFGYCLQLESVHAGNLTKVPMGAFYGCCNLQTVSSEVGITSVGIAAFATTPKLTTVDISTAATDIQAYAFYRSGFEYDWSTLDSHIFGFCATWKQLNPYDNPDDEIWKGLTIKECENPVPTLFNQEYSEWADEKIGGTSTRYRAGCALFAFIHAYCGLYNLKLDSVEDFESIANSYEEGILGKFKPSMSDTYPVFCPAFGLSYTHGEIKTGEDLQKIYDALADGKYVIVNVGQAQSNDESGLGGHVALLYGVRKDGKLLVADSGLGNESLHGITSAIHFKHFLHTGKANGNATDYYIISNGEPSMNTIDEKLDALMQTVNSGFHVESGELHLTSDSFENTSTLKRYHVNCSAGAKMFVLTPTAETATAIISQPYTSGIGYYSLGVECNFVNPTTAESNGWYQGVVTAWIVQSNKTMKAAGGITADNTDGVDFDTYRLIAGDYVWKAYYWND